jgi:hypothetical protein
MECSHDIALALKGFGPNPTQFLRGHYTGPVFPTFRVDAAWLVFDGWPKVNVDIRWAEPVPYRNYVAEDEDEKPIASCIPTPAGLDESYRLEVAHFLNCVEQNTPTICPLSEGLQVLEICAKVEQWTEQQA